MIKTVVTKPEYLKATHIFDGTEDFDCIPAPPDESGLASKIRETGARFAVIGVENYSGELYDALPSGGAIVRFGVGHDGVDKSLAGSRGILCCNTPGVLDDSVAECTVSLILAAARHITECHTDTKSGNWNPRLGTELAGKTLVIAGCGKIGSKVAKIAKNGFGMHVVGMDIIQPQNAGLFDEFTSDFDHAAAKADFLSLHIPDLPETSDFINSESLQKVKDNAILINTARGGIVEENAVYDAIESGKLAGAALDVFKTEPYQPQNPRKDLRDLNNVIMTPHIASSSYEASERMARKSLKNIEHAVNGDTDKMNLIR